MITTTRPNPVSTNMESRKFTIAVNGKSFGVMINGVYSDKIGAVVRELAANAWDAHIQRGNPEVPFEITLPNSLNPVFRVRDYGVAMDHDTVMNLYTTLFESSKDDSNEVVGMLGIGSKSPFAYTTTFGLTSILNGEAYVYNVFLDSEGIPSISVVDKYPTDAPQGVEVVVNVKTHDCDAFRTAWEKVALGYVGGTMPIIKGVETPPSEVLFTGNGWTVIKSPAPLRSSRSVWLVRQGCVTYHAPQDYAYDYSDNHRIIVDVPIGVASITANRESLAWDDPTRRAVSAHIDKAKSEVVDVIKALVAAQATDPLARARVALSWLNVLPIRELNEELTKIATIDISDFDIRGYAKQGEGSHYKNFFIRNTASTKVIYGIDDIKKVVRAKSRLAIERKRHNSSGTMLIARFASDAERRLFTLRTDLTPIHLSELPDPGPRAKGDGSYRKAVDKTVKPGEFWTVAWRGSPHEAVATPTHREWGSIRERYPNLFYSDVRVVSVTPLDVERRKLDPRQNYLTAVRNTLQADRQLKSDLFASAVNRYVNEYASSVIAATKLLQVSGVPGAATAQPSFIQNFPDYYSGMSATVEDIKTRALTLTQKLFACYPSLDKRHRLTEAEIDNIIANPITTTNGGIS